MSTQRIIATVRQELYDVGNALSKWFEEDSRYLTYQPVDGGWSAVQILEHIALTSHYLLLLIDKASIKAQQRAQRMPVTMDWDKYVLVPAELEAIGIHKSFVWIRPEHMKPVGNVAVDDLRDRINGQFIRCDAHLNKLKNGEGTLCATTMTVNGIGKLDVYQYIYFLALHARRHLKQLEENKMEYVKKN
jgi:hypothetical protein